MPEKEKEGSKAEASSKKSEVAKRVRAPKPKSGEKSASKPKPPAEELSEDDKVSDSIIHNAGYTRPTLCF
jgi:hypothetical protein